MPRIEIKFQCIYSCQNEFCPCIYKEFKLKKKRTEKKNCFQLRDKINFISIKIKRKKNKS